MFPGELRKNLNECCSENSQSIQIIVSYLVFPLSLWLIMVKVPHQPFNDRTYEAECHNVHAWSMYISTSCNNKTTIYYFYVYFKTVAHFYVQNSTGSVLYWLNVTSIGLLSSHGTSLQKRKRSYIWWQFSIPIIAILQIESRARLRVDRCHSLEPADSGQHTHRYYWSLKFKTFCPNCHAKHYKILILCTYCRSKIRIRTNA